jgi:predicted dehydrogenase
MQKRYRVALVGCGRMGATIDDEVRDRPDSWRWLPYSHAAGYMAVRRTQLVAVADAVPEKARAVQGRYQVPNSYTDYRDMIERERPDILSVATRPTPYAEIVQFAAEHGVRGIYCDKPLCRSLEEADRMVAAVERHGVKFNYGTQRRYMPLYRKVREFVGAGELGDVNCVVGYCGAGAALWGLTHAADMLLFLSGDAEVDFVQGTLAVDDSAWEGDRLNADPGITSAYVRFATGMHGYLVAGGGWEFELCGTKGKLRTQENGAACNWRRATGQWDRLEEVPFPEFEPGSGTVGCILDLVEALDTGRETSGNIRLARRSFEMIMGIIESHRRGGARVSLPLEERTLYVGRPDW